VRSSPVPARKPSRRPGRYCIRLSRVLVFVSDLMTEVRKTCPEIEASGSEWVDAASFLSGCAEQCPEPGQAASPGRADAADR
jgi:hypothetical protein